MAEHVNDGGAAARKRIWIVFGILSAITAVEFVIAFAIGAGLPRTALFMLLTVVKAFYIVADFMHLKHEVKDLIITIILPLTFIIWFIVAMLVEGDWYNGGWYKFLG